MFPKKIRETRMKRITLNNLFSLAISFMLIGCMTTAESTEVAVNKTIPAGDPDLQRPSEVKPDAQVPVSPEIVFISVPTACIKVASFQKTMKEQYNEVPKIFWVHTNTQSKIATPGVLYYNEKKDTVTVALFLEIANSVTSERNMRACLISTGSGLKIEGFTNTQGTRINFLK